ncbi:MAG: CHAD domain-containing protein [Candidatus Obscuribacterales bacterium]|nr:CHAD domain-containing protein [Candidatus Obscuribacterales bacterium]
MTSLYQGNKIENIFEADWLEYEYLVALDALASLESMARVLDKKKNNKRVHNTRIAFRRWYSVWSILARDLWQTEKFEVGLGKRVRACYKTLGKVRDWDVNYKLAKSLTLSESIVRRWAKKRSAVRAAAFKQLRKLALRDLVIDLRKYVVKRHKKLAEGRDKASEPAFTHIERFLSIHEKETAKLAAKASNIEGLHAMRLSIKAWRYILVEFFGLSSIKLVQAQQLLGKIVDLERMKGYLTLMESGKSVSKNEIVRAMEIVSKEEEKLISELDSLKAALPYGFRPGHVSQAAQN